MVKITKPRLYIKTGKTVIPFNVYVITEKAYSHLNAVGG